MLEEFKDWSPLMKLGEVDLRLSRTKALLGLFITLQDPVDDIAALTAPFYYEAIETQEILQSAMDELRGEPLPNGTKQILAGGAEEER